MSTLAYSAPETLDGQRSTASDVWSFGVLLLEMVVGRQPLLNLHWGALLAALAAGDVGTYFEWPASTHPVLRRLGSACLSLDAGKRPSAHVISKVMVKLEDSLKHPTPGHGHPGHHPGGPAGLAPGHRAISSTLGAGSHSAQMTRPLQHRLSHTGVAPTSQQLQQGRMAPAAFEPSGDRVRAAMPPPSAMQSVCSGLTSSAGGV